MICLHAHSPLCRKLRVRAARFKCLPRNQYPSDFVVNRLTSQRAGRRWTDDGEHHDAIAQRHSRTGQWTPEREFATLVALMRCADRWTAVRAQAMFRWRARQCVEGAEQSILAMQATHEQRCRWLDVWRARQARLSLTWAPQLDPFLNLLRPHPANEARRHDVIHGREWRVPSDIEFRSSRPFAVIPGRFDSPTPDWRALFRAIQVFGKHWTTAGQSAIVPEHRPSTPTALPIVIFI